ncbi:hypothetical protein GS506_11845 [Rhodococcus hoagii]|nr:hypothetical protein [Prescottella equi]
MRDLSGGMGGFLRRSAVLGGGLCTPSAARKVCTCGPVGCWSAGPDIGCENCLVISGGSGRRPGATLLP